MTLRTAKKDIEATHTGVKVLAFVADATDRIAVTSAISAVEKGWWSDFEINVKGAFIFVHALLKVASSNATVVEITTGVAHYPAFPNFSAYGASKLAWLKFSDSVQTENSSMHFVHVHPGVVLGQKAPETGAKFALDDIELPPSFIVRACSPEARFLKGKTI